MKHLLTAAALAALVTFSAPATASADWLFTPYVGSTFGGNASFGDFDDFDDEFERRITFGASLGWMGNGIAGFEIDFGHTPNFFQDTLGPDDFEFGDGHVTTVMGNVVVGAPIGGQTGPGVRLYGSGGAGLIRSTISATDFFDDLNKSDLGVNVGAGVHGFFNDNVGIRGDIRYFRSLADDDDELLDLALSDFDFWRATVGVSFRFGN